MRGLWSGNLRVKKVKLEDRMYGAAEDMGTITAHLLSKDEYESLKSFKPEPIIETDKYIIESVLDHVLVTMAFVTRRKTDDLVIKTSRYETYDLIIFPYLVDNHNKFNDIANTTLNHLCDQLFEAFKK